MSDREEYPEINSYITSSSSVSTEEPSDPTYRIKKRDRQVRGDRRITRSLSRHLESESEAEASGTIKEESGSSDMEGESTVGEGDCTLVERMEGEGQNISLKDVLAIMAGQRREDDERREREEQARR